MSIEALNWSFNQNIKPASCKFVLVALANFADEHELCWPRISTLSKLTGLSKSAVKNGLRDLEKNGFIIRGMRQGTRGNDASIYRLKVTDKCIDDHPFSIFVRGANSDPLGGQIVTAGGQIVTPTGTNSDPLNPSVEPLFNQKEKKALTRDEFLRVIDRGFQSGSFKEWEHLTESEIKSIAEDCLDFHCSKGEYPSKGDPVAAVRYWIRNGIKRGKIRKAVQQGDTTAPKAKEYPNPEQLWQSKMKDHMDIAHWNAWIRPLWHDGNGKLYAPNAFTKTRVENDYMHDIQTVLKGVTLDIKPYQPQSEKELEHV